MSAPVHTFRAADSTSALAAVKAALGPDAILISTRSVQGGLFRRAELEATPARGSAGAAAGRRGRGAEPVLAEELVRQAMQLSASLLPSSLTSTVRDLVGE